MRVRGPCPSIAVIVPRTFRLDLQTAAVNAGILRCHAKQSGPALPATDYVGRDP